MDTTLYDAVARLAADSPYKVEPTERGFDVEVDVADAQWYGLIDKQGLKQSLTHHVSVDPDAKTFKVVDDIRRVEWQVGADGARPVLSASAGRAVGRVVELGGRKEWAWDEKLRYGKVLDYTLNSEESRELIRTAAREVGYQERMPGVVKGAVVLAGIAIVGAVVTVIVLLTGLLLGKF